MTDDEKEEYRIVNERISKEMDEFYHVNSIFLLVQAGLLATQAFGRQLYIIQILGLVTAILWMWSLSVQYIYKSWWLKQARKLESENGIWKRLEKCKPAPIGLMKLIQVLPVIFIFAWLANILHFAGLLY